MPLKSIKELETLTLDPMEEPSFFDSFPQFTHSDLHFSDPSLPIASDLDFDDLDNLDLDFSIDDLIVLPPNEENEIEVEKVGSSPNPRSDITTNSNSNSSPGSPESGVIYQEEKQEEESSWRLKRKIDDDGGNRIGNPNTNANLKIRRSDEVNSPGTFSSGGGVNDEDEKRKVRLIRNRESAQLSRQRKKHYVEELEEKVKIMNSTIADLNAKISFYMSENARLHQQLNGTKGNDGKGNGNGNPVPQVVYPPPPPPPHFPPYHFPWIPYALRPNGHPVPYIPIPRLKPTQPVSAPKMKRSENKKGVGKTKKVASASLLGLFLVMLVFGGVVNFGIGGGGGKGYGNGRVLNVTGHGSSLNSSHEFGKFSGKMGSDHSGGNNKNTSESLPALLYVPRNGKHVEINGNLIIHSVLASERAMAQAKSNGEGKQPSGKEGTGLAIPGLMASALAVHKGTMEMGRHFNAYRNTAEHQRALPSESHDTYREHIKSTRHDSPLQQWFREGLAGPIFSSGTCSEVFQFEVSPSAVNPIVPATSGVNSTADKYPQGKIKSRRILYRQPIPLNGTTLNNTQHFGKPNESSDTFNGNDSMPSSMVVSILADPREAGDGNGDGMITPKSLSRIFVVVLVDSVKYVTYSCMLPLKSHGPHLVN